MNPDRLAELHEQRQFLLRSIADLGREHDAGDVDDHDFIALRDGYVARAASVLREIDDGRTAAPSRPRRPGIAAAWIVGTIALAALGGWLVAHYSGQRTTSAGQVALAPADEVVQQLAVAKQAWNRGDSNAAVTAYRRVLELEPSNVEATAYTGALLASSGSAAESAEVVSLGVAQIRKAIGADPTYADPHCLLAVALVRFVKPADTAAARTELAACDAAKPPAEMRGLVELIRPDLA